MPQLFFLSPPPSSPFFSKHLPFSFAVTLTELFFSFLLLLLLLRELYFCPLRTCSSLLPKTTTLSVQEEAIFFFSQCDLLDLRPERFPSCHFFSPLLWVASRRRGKKCQTGGKKNGYKGAAAEGRERRRKSECLSKSNSRDGHKFGRRNEEGDSPPFLVAQGEEGIKAKYTLTSLVRGLRGRNCIVSGRLSRTEKKGLFIYFPESRIRQFLFFFPVAAAADVFSCSLSFFRF